MKVGTRSLLYGSHQFVLHPLYLALAWRRLYRRWPRGWRLWVAFVAHDWGYWGAPEMDGPVGALHPHGGARLVARLATLGRKPRYRQFHYQRWYEFAACHSRTYARLLNLPASPLMRAARLAAIAERAAAATPGPWRWRGTASSHHVMLQALISMRPVVMDFVRWGTQSARPVFVTDGLIVRPPWVLPESWNPWKIEGIDHPDARFIEHSRTDVDFLLGEVDRLRALAHDLADKENGARTEQMRALHAAGIIASDESLHAHIERADAFTARQHDRINFGEEKAGGG